MDPRNHASLTTMEERALWQYAKYVYSNQVDTFTLDEILDGVQEANTVRGSMRESKIEYFFHRLVGDWNQAQRLGNYWREHYGLPALPLDPVEAVPPAPGPSSTSSAPAAPVHHSLADTSTVDPATVYVAQLLTTLRSLPQPAPPQETRDQMTALVQDFQLGTLFTPADLSFLGDQLHQLASFLDAATETMDHADVHLTDVAAQAGLQRLLNNQASKQQATGATLDVALADLDSLRRHAADAAKAAKQVVSGLSKPAGYEGGSSEVDSDVSKLLEDFGLLQADGSTISMSGGQKKDDIVADVAKVSAAALEKKGTGALLLAHDVFCLVNRARGTALVSPEEVIKALRTCSKPGGPLRMRKLGSAGAVAVALARTSDADMDVPLLQLLEDAPLSAFRVSIELKITATEARYLLQDAEKRAVIVRDDAPECVYFYRNFFNDF
eukprot:s1543_g8.t1